MTAAVILYRRSTNGGPFHSAKTTMLPQTFIEFACDRPFSTLKRTLEKTKIASLDLTADTILTVAHKGSFPLIAITSSRAGCE